eukprot:1333506-Pyramimonas_sp.AAC.1
MLGTSESPEFKAKAAETGVLLKWAVDLCRRYRAVIKNGEIFLAAGECLIEYLSIVKAAPCLLTQVQYSRLLHLAIRH